MAPWAFYLPFSLLGYPAKDLLPQGFARWLESSMSEADTELVSDEAVARFFAENVEEAFRQGVRGPADDPMILYETWESEVAEIEFEVDLRYGTEDRFAPSSYVLYLDEALPNSTLTPYPGEGHLFVLTLFGAVFEQV